MGKSLVAWAAGLCLLLAATSASADASRDDLLRTLGDVPLRLVDDEQDAREGRGKKEEEKKEESPWLLAPLFSLNPKLGFAGGAIVGYMH